MREGFEHKVEEEEQNKNVQTFQQPRFKKAQNLYYDAINYVHITKINKNYVK